jgi:hypothetical protein
MDYTEFVGQDVYKKTIAVAIAAAGRGEEVRSSGTILDTREAAADLMTPLAGIAASSSLTKPAVVGTALYRQLTVAPLLVGRCLQPGAVPMSCSVFFQMRLEDFRLLNRRVVLSELFGCLKMFDCGLVISGLVQGQGQVIVGFGG